MSGNIYTNSNYIKARREREAALEDAERQRQQHEAENAEIHRQHLERVAQEQEARNAQFATEREAAGALYEASLKEQARQGWAGTSEAFEQAWENGLRDKVIADAVSHELATAEMEARTKYNLNL
jgi:hypothetical protein